MPNSILQNAQVLQPMLNGMLRSQGSDNQIGLGDLVSSQIAAQPGLGQPAMSISNRATGGAIGVANATIDNAHTFLVNQTTAAQTLSLPAPSDPAVVRTAHVINAGSASFVTPSGHTVAPGEAHAQLWHGSAWVPIK